MLFQDAWMSRSFPADEIQNCGLVRARWSRPARTAEMPRGRKLARSIRFSTHSFRSRRRRIPGGRAASWTDSPLRPRTCSSRHRIVPAADSPTGCGPDIAGNSDVLELIEAAGADLIGFTSHDRARLRAVGLQCRARPRQESVESGLHLRRLIVGLGCGGGERRRRGRARLRHRRLASHPGVRLRRHRLETHPWAGPGKGAMPLAPTLDTIGLLARSANDMMPLLPFMGRLSGSPAKITRAAVLARLSSAESDPAIRQAMARCGCGAGRPRRRDREPRGAAGDRGDRSPLYDRHAG